MIVFPFEHFHFARCSNFVIETKSSNGFWITSDTTQHLSQVGKHNGMIHSTHILNDGEKHSNSIQHKTFRSHISSKKRRFPWHERPKKNASINGAKLDESSNLFTVQASAWKRDATDWSSNVLSGRHSTAICWIRKIVARHITTSMTVMTKRAKASNISHYIHTRSHSVSTAEHSYCSSPLLLMPIHRVNWAAGEVLCASYTQTRPSYVSLCACFNRHSMQFELLNATATSAQALSRFLFLRSPAIPYLLAVLAFVLLRAFPAATDFLQHRNGANSAKCRIIKTGALETL